MIINRPLAHGGLLKPTHIVIHCMGEFIRPDKWTIDYYRSPKRSKRIYLRDKDYYAIEWLEVMEWSAHVLLTPSGDSIVCVPDNKKAWHAKARGFNHKSLGVEFLVPGAYNLATLKEKIKTDYVGSYQKYEGIDLVQTWMEEFDISMENIVKHSDIDKRKPDPGAGFPWNAFLDEL